MNSTKAALTLLCIAVLAIRCSENDPEPSVTDLSVFAQEFMGMRLGSPNASASKLSESAVNQSFQSMIGARSFSGGRIAGDTTVNGGGVSDTVIYVNPWASCAIVTSTVNSDGSTTTTYDYGDGCEEGWGDYKYFMHGKTVQTYKYTSQQTGALFRDSYLFKMLYDNYGGNYGTDSSAWNMDGNSYYEGFSQYDSVSHEFSGSYAYNDTSLYQSNDKDYVYKSRGRSSYNETGSVVEESTYEYGDGIDYYRSQLIEPLISNYSCNVFDEAGLTDTYIWVAVSGREIVTYSQGGKTGTFEIDYGDGECDNVIYIIENGIRVRVDLGPGWLCGFQEG